MTEVRQFTERFVSSTDEAEIAMVEWPGSDGPLVCIPGLTSHSRAFAGLATELPDYRVLALDCRGRGRSSKVPPYGMDQHADDVAAVLDSAGIDRATLVGHSMGAYVASAFNARYPERVERLVFVDGGYPQQFPPGMTPDDLLESFLGTVVGKIRRTWTSVAEYIACYENTSVYRLGFDRYARAHFHYDLTGTPPRLRTRVVEDCIAPDWREVLDRDLVGKRLESVTAPLLLLRAPGGFTGRGDEIITAEVRDAIVRKVEHATVVDVPDTNHYTILLSVAGARGVARVIEEFVR